MVDRVKAVVHLDHLLHNFQAVKDIHQDKRVMAVVKADAYGHGAVETARYLEKNSCDFFAVTDMLEGIELREAGIQSPILIFGKTSPNHAKHLHDYHLIQTVDGYDYAQSLNQEKMDIDIHIILDTGMSRFGIYCHQDKDHDKTVKEIEKILDLTHLHMGGIYTHFALADENKDADTDHQYKMFIDVISTLEKHDYQLGIKHCSNSASTIKFPLHQLDMVRTGIAMYGYPPVHQEKLFLPVMEVFAKVISIRDLLPGDGISYGWTFRVEKPMRIASIAIGYADGYFRIFSGKDYFVFNKHKLPILGRVCMGITMVDVGNVDIQVGDEVEIFGLHKSLESMAETAQTISYELLTNMRKSRVKFIYQT